MPIYVYRCPNGHEFEVIQSMSEDPVSRCEECGAPVERVFQPIAVHFKGSGFYSTDYGRSRKRESKDAEAAPAKSDEGAKKEEKKAKPAEA